MKSTEKSAGRRLGVLTIDQAVAGASNVLIAILAARLLSAESFGLFWIVFLTYGVVQGSARALVGDPLLLHPAEARDRAGDAIGTGCLLGLALGAVVLLGGLVAHVWDAQLGDAFIALAVCAPLLVLQDLGRYLSIATRRPGSALVLDLVWLVLMFAGMALIVVTGSDSLWQFIAAWGVSGAIAGSLVFWQYREVRWRLSLAWLKETWPISWRYWLSYSSAQGSALGTAIMLSAVAGAKAVGGVQAALLLQRPFVVFVVASMASGVVDISHTNRERALVQRIVTKITIVTTVFAVLNGVVLLALPDVVGEAFLGESWDEAQPLLLAAAVQIVMMGVTSGARAGLLGLRAIRLSTAIDVGKTALIVALTVIGAVFGGALGAMWAIAIGHTLGAILWWVAFLHRNARSGDTREPTESQSSSMGGPPPSQP